MLASQRRALAALGDDHIALRRRLEMRLAAEAVYDGAPVEPVREALARARECGDGAVLAEALSLAHHAVDGAGLGIGVAAARRGADCRRVGRRRGMLAVMGLMWRTVDLYQLDRPGAERSLGELRRRVEALGCMSIAYVVALIDVMRMTREGRIEEAEDAARAAYELGSAVGDADATGYYAAHVMRIRSLQGREAELLDLVAQRRRLAAHDGSRAGPAGVDRGCRGTRWRCGSGTLDARRHASRRHRSVEHVAGGDRLARRRRRRARRRGARPRRLRRARAVRLVAARAVAGCHMSRVGRAAAGSGGDGVRRYGARARAFRAGTRRGRADRQPSDDSDRQEQNWHGRSPRLAAARARAELLLSVAIEEADSMGMAVRRAEWTEWLAALDAKDAGAAACTVARIGNRWVDAPPAPPGRRCRTWSGCSTSRYSSTGLAKTFPASELAGSSLIDGARHEVVDRQTLEQYRQRVRELDAEIAEADDDADLGRAEALRLEREDLRDELAGCSGSPVRSAPSPTRRSVRAPLCTRRSSVRSTPSRRSSPASPTHLRESIVTGRVCRYEPC